MLQGVFKRAAVAILLMGTLIAPAEICRQQAQKGTHDCCVGMSQSSTSVQDDCCTAKTTPPAAVAPDYSSPVPLMVAQEFVGAGETSSLNASVALAVITPQSPPTGAFILRI